MYKLPDTLEEDITRFGTLANDYRNKNIETVQFKAYRVPMGVYEQRQDEVYMSRIRTTGGVIYPKQFSALIDIAGRHHSDLLHITTRQEIQIQNLKLEEVEPVLHEIKAIGLSTKGGGGNTIRNIMVTEDSGISSNEVFDTTPYAMALTSKLIAEADSYLLPRKMKIAFSSDSKHPDYAAINDLGFVATIRNGEKGFKVYVGGGGGSKPTIGWVLFDFVPVDELFIIAEALKKFFSDHGNRKNRHKARLRFIFYKLGEEETLRLIKEYYQQAKETISPFIPESEEDERPPFSYTTPVINSPDEQYEVWKKRYVIPQKQSGYNSILVPFLHGNIRLNDTNRVKRLQQLLLFIDRFGKHTLRFTPGQNILLRNIPTVALPEVYGLLQEIIPDITAPILVNNIVSCTGADTCRLGIGLSKGLATAIRKRLQNNQLNLDKLASLRIRISGCPNSCGQQLQADLGFSGKILRNNRIYPGYQVYMGAGRGSSPKFAETIGNINARDIPEFVHRLLESYLNTGTLYPDFTSYAEAEGKETAKKLIEEYKNIPSFDEDKNYYFDWGAENIFSVISRGAAECSAGLFDMIEVDLNAINSSKAELEKGADNTRSNTLLYDMLYSSSRMLLVTRGAEPKTTADIFNLFIRNFIDYGFINERFRKIISLARDHKRTDFNFYRKEIYDLADAVAELYKNMDDSLQFKNIKEKKEAAGKEKKDIATFPDKQQEVNKRKFKDLRGVACPMNFVQTKIQLAGMQSGEELEIRLDDGAPINNVPGSVRGEGHEILEQIQQKEGDWKVIIKKK
ncbi:MAG: sulfurtransferase TusA family protein [Candidatus Azobacteroides sp.]|nr:sulfurtransferase TusA family protein [Candidatus Azobacteroides sp.]